MKYLSKITVLVIFLFSAAVLFAGDVPVIKIICMDSAAGRTEVFKIKKAFEKGLEAEYALDVFLMEEAKLSEKEIIPAADYILLISFSELDNNLYISIKLIFVDPLEKKERVVTSVMFVDRTYQSFVKNIPGYIKTLNWYQWFLKKTKSIQ